MPVTYLQELEAWAAAHASSCLESLGAGASDSDIARWEAELSPACLPGEVKQLSRYRDGQVPGVSFCPPYGWLSLADAMAEYRQAMTYAREGGNPLRFPLFAFEGNMLAVICGLEPIATSPLLLIYGEETDVFEWHASLAALMQATRDAYREGVYTPGAWEGDAAQEEAIRHRSSQREGEVTFSRFSTHLWPEAWRRAAGVSPEDRMPQGGSMPIAQIVREMANGARTAAIVQGQGTQLTGSLEAIAIVLTAASGKIVILCPQTAEGYRELRIRDRNEIEVRRQFPEESTSPLASHFGLDLAPIATRIVPLSN